MLNVKNREEYNKYFREYRKKHSKKFKEYKKKWRKKKGHDYLLYKKKYPERVRAHKIVYKAVKVGFLVRKKCKKCGDKNTQAHHEDYSKPLDVIWLCQKHHSEHHSGL